MTEIVACIYTCASHEGYLRQFRQSAVAEVLSRRASTVLEVYANPSLARARRTGDVLEVPCPESYEQLTVKTHRMLQYCAEQLSFDALVKIDVTVVMTDMSAPEYEGRQPLDQDALCVFLEGIDGQADYTGFLLHQGAGRGAAENWARKKGLTIDYARLFGDHPMPSFYSGKCYALGHDLARFVAQHGAAFAEEHHRHFPGTEDVMVGRLYQAFLARS